VVLLSWTDERILCAPTGGSAHLTCATSRKLCAIGRRLSVARAHLMCALTLGAMKTLLEASLRVPEDVAVIGFDGIDEALYATPSLSTVAVNMEDIAHTAVSLLMERIQGTRTGPPIRVQLPFNLLARGSTIGSNFTFAAPTQTLP